MGVQRLAVCLLAWSTLGYTVTLNSKHAHLAVALDKRRDSTVLPAPPAPEACTAPKCLEYAKHIQQSLAPNYTAMDPCVDFERYSCDGWRATHNYRPEQASISVSSFMSDTIRELLHGILEGSYVETPAFTGANKTADNNNFDKMKTAYNTCKNEDAIKSYGVSPIRKILEGLESVYPAKGSGFYSNSSSDELTKAITWLYKRNVVGLVSASTSVSSTQLPTMMTATQCAFNGRKHAIFQ
jgi:endothelin-converting enzyme